MTRRQAKKIVKHYSWRYKKSSISKAIRIMMARPTEEMRRVIEAYNQFRQDIWNGR